MTTAAEYRRRRGSERIEFRQTGGRWTWTYLDERGAVLRSNHDYGSREAAAAAADKAYPDVPHAHPGSSPEPPPARRSLLTLGVLGLIVGVLLAIVWKGSGN